ncbi:MAG: peptidoglycan-associated lipoprotein Pal [Nitrospiraceae bacterium]|nr:peptidoglycan-associated lipoprotein Pal [Nitrospiraceae bacterium]
MKRFSALVFALFLVIAFAGCAQQKKVSTAPEQPATTQKAVEGEKKVEAPKVETMAVKESAAGSMFSNVLFDFDKYNIRSDAKPTLKSVADWAISNKTAKIVLEGNCDERGTNEYNLALGEKRAKSVRDYLVSLGTSKNMLSTISFGKEKPLCTEKTEGCWQENRRVEFKVAK